MSTFIKAYLSLVNTNLALGIKKPNVKLFINNLYLAKKGYIMF